MPRPDSRTDLLPEGEAASLAAHYKVVATLDLNATVPHDVTIQFEVAKNLYLYAWNVYRFYSVAEMQAFAALEFGLRQALPLPLPKAYWSNAHRDPPLSKLLLFASDQQLILNEGFTRWHRAAERRARERQVRERIQQMEKPGLSSIEWDDGATVEVTQADQDWDLVSLIRHSLPDRRNIRAHGSPQLTPQVFGTLELVVELLNQLFPKPQEMT